MMLANLETQVAVWAAVATTMITVGGGVVALAIKQLFTIAKQIRDSMIDLRTKQAATDTKTDGLKDRVDAQHDGLEGVRAQVGNIALATSPAAAQDVSGTTSAQPPPLQPAQLHGLVGSDAVSRMKEAVSHLPNQSKGT